MPLPSQARGSEHVDLLVSPGCARDSERRLICCSLTFTGRRLRTGLSVSVSRLQAGDSDRSFCYCPFLRRTETQNNVSVNVFSIAVLRLRTEVFLLVSLWTCQRLRTGSVFWEGTFISFRLGGDCNLEFLHFQAVIGCFHQSGGHSVAHPSFLLWKLFA